MQRPNCLRSWCLIALLTLPVAAARGEDKTLRILLLGDSTTIGSICRHAEPDGPHLEDVVRLLLAAEGDLPPAEVINQGRDGEFIHGLLASGRYEKEIAPLGDLDYVLIRYGLNDVAKREDFEDNFTKDYAELIGRLRFGSGVRHRSSRSRCRGPCASAIRPARRGPNAAASRSRRRDRKGSRRRAGRAARR